MKNLLLLFGLCLLIQLPPARAQSNGDVLQTERALAEADSIIVEQDYEIDLLYQQIADSTEKSASYREVTVPAQLSQAFSKGFRKGLGRGRGQGLLIGSGAATGLHIGWQFGPVGAVVGTLAGGFAGAILPHLVKRRNRQAKPTPTF